MVGSAHRSTDVNLSGSHLTRPVSDRGPFLRLAGGVEH